jgi:hypothetical protein
MNTLCFRRHFRDGLSELHGTDLPYRAVKHWAAQFAAALPFPGSINYRRVAATSITQQLVTSLATCFTSDSRIHTNV